MSVGGSGTGFAVVEIGGKWYLIHHSVGYSVAGPAVVLNAWTHLEMVRRRSELGVRSALFVNGADTGVSMGSSLNPPADSFYVGANRVASGPEGQFKGQIDNVVLNNAAPVILKTDSGFAGNQYRDWHHFHVDGIRRRQSPAPIRVASGWRCAYEFRGRLQRNLWAGVRGRLRRL